MKKELETFDQVLDYAIAREAEAEAFYRTWMDKVTDPEVQALLQEFAEEECMHKIKLQKVKEGQFSLLSGRPAPRFRVPPEVPSVTPREDMTVTEALGFAVRKEKAAYRMYLDMAVDAPSEQLMQLFLALAREEANHKVRFEIEYDDLTMAES